MNLGLDGASHSRENPAHNIDHLVQGWNEWSRLSMLSDYENYLNGHIKYFLEYAGARRYDSHEIGGVYVLGSPHHVPAETAERDVGETTREIWDLAPYDFARKRFVISYWGQDSVLVTNIDFVNEFEKFYESLYEFYEVLGPFYDAANISRGDLQSAVS